MITEKLTYSSFARLSSEMAPDSVQVTPEGLTAYFADADPSKSYLRIAPCLIVVRDGEVYRVRGVDLSTPRRRIRVARALKLKGVSPVTRGPKKIK